MDLIKEEVIRYYIEDNNTFKDSASFFNVSESKFAKYLKENSIKKPKDKHSELIKKSKLEKYSDANFNNRNKAEQTCLDKYGVNNPFKDTEHIKQSFINKYGVEHPMKNKDISNKSKEHHNYEESIKKGRQTYLEKTGYNNPYSNPEVIDKIVDKRFGNGQYINLEHTIETCQEKYGVNYPCQRKEARIMSSNNSKPNNSFAILLDKNNISYEREFVLDSYSYDFKIDNILIEIDPTATHNSTWGIFDKVTDKLYHLNKTLTAQRNNYRCIHIFDWDDEEKIISLLLKRTTIYARNCDIKLVNVEDTKEFINKYHLQNYAKDSIRIGLYYNDELVSIMTFDKPRYNKNYEYELIRYCSNCNIIGGEEKLFSYFIKKYNPISIVSYCDNSKFEGKIYNKLEFKISGNLTPSKHWYNMKTKQHITDNLLRKYGYDGLFKTNFGKGSSNEELMIKNGFVEVYDCGQITYIWNK